MQEFLERAPHLAHWVYHHELYLNLIKASLAGTPVAPPKLITSSHHRGCAHPRVAIR